MSEQFDNPRRFPLGKVLFGAFMIPWRKRRELLKLLGVPVLLGTVVQFARWLDGDAYFYVFFLVIGCELLLLAVIAIAVHRLVLLRDVTEPTIFRSTPQKRKRKYLVVSVGLALITLFLWLPLASISEIGANSVAGTIAGEGRDNTAPLVLSVKLLSVLPALYIASRLSLFLPALAVDEQSSFRASWAMTRGVGGSVLIVVGVLPIGLSVLFSLLGKMESIVISSMVLWLLTAFTTVIQVAALSLTYWELSKTR